MAIDAIQLKELAISIADRIYIRIENWNLYLGDAGLSEALAIECQANLDNGARIAARKAVESLQVNLGGANSKIPLSRLIPPAQISELEDILESYY